MILRATFQTSILGGVFAIVVGFLIMFVPSLFDQTDISEKPLSESENLSFSALTSDYKSALYTASQTQFKVGQYQQNLNINRFKAIVEKLVSDPKMHFNQTKAMMRDLGFELQQDNRYLYIHDSSQSILRGLFIINKKAKAQHVITVHLSHQ